MAEGARASRQVRRARARRKESVPKPFHLDRLAIPLLLAAGFFAYHNALHGPFVLDDIRAISQNETIRTLWPPWGILSPPVHSPVTGRPLVNLSLAVNYAIGGERVTSYHLLNLAIHLLAALALFGIIRRTLRDRAPRYREEATGMATAAALLWVVHPLTTESVDYTIQRTELLMGLFFLLTLYCAIRGFGPPERKNWYGAALAAFVLGLGSKEVIVVAPAIVLVYDWLFESASLRDALRRHWRLYAGYAAVLGLYVLFVGTRLRRAFTGLSGRAVAPWDYALTQSAVIVHYLRLAFWPHPLAALVVLAVLGGWELLRRWEAPRAARLAAAAALALSLALVTVRRNDDYRTVLGFWTDAVAKRPDSPRARLWLGYYLYKQGRNAEALRHETEAVRLQPENGEAQYSLGVVLTKFGRIDDAIHRFRQAVRINPRYVEAHYNLAIALSRQGRKEQAAEHLETAIRLQPDFSPARNALSNIRGGAIR